MPEPRSIPARLKLHWHVERSGYILVAPYLVHLTIFFGYPLLFSLVLIFHRWDIVSPMTVGLFVPCYIDQFYPHVAQAALTLLQRLGCKVEVPLAQTCCGQPLANAGFALQARPVMAHFAHVFAPYEYIVAPSGSCVFHVQHHLETDNTAALQHLRVRTYELCQFLREVLQVERIPACFPHRMVPAYSIVRDLLRQVKGLELVEPSRPDECCGFGGTFAVEEEAVSVRMGQDRLQDFQAAGAEVVTSTDMSCLMHLEGLARRQGLPLRFMHVAEILLGSV